MSLLYLSVSKVGESSCAAGVHDAAGTSSSLALAAGQRLVPKGPPVKKRRGVGTGYQAHMLGLVEQGMDSITQHARSVDAAMNDIPRIKRRVEEIFEIVAMRDERNWGDLVLNMYRKISKELNDRDQKDFDKMLISSMISFTPSS